jgi:hypothetical protein
MPGYVHKMLTRFRPQFLDPAHRPAQTPGRYITPVYGRKSPQLTSVDDSPRLPPESVTELQAIIRRHSPVLRACRGPIFTSHFKRTRVQTSAAYDFCDERRKPGPQLLRWKT